MKNRFMLAPLTNCQSHPDGRLSSAEERWLTMRAQGGFGLVSTCAAHVQAIGQGFPGQLGVFGDQHVDGLGRLARTIVGEGALALVQLHHAGIRAPKELTGQIPVGPSDDAKTGARALTLEEVDQVIEDFVRAAQRAERAGFDGVELHCAHGYLLCLFLSAQYNRRSDAYGGSLQNRSRVLFAIVHEIRARCRPDFIVGVRLSPERFGVQLPEIRELAQQLIDSGQIDFLDLSLWDCFKEPEQPELKGRTLMSYFMDLERGPVKIGVAGKLHDPGDLERVLDMGADFPILGRVAILHHDYPSRLAADPAFVPARPPVTREYLSAEGLSEPFIRYMGNWAGFVASAATTDPLVDVRACSMPDETHRVLNQPRPLVDYDVFSSNQALVEAVQREGAGWALGSLRELGVIVGGRQAMEWARQADRFPPILHTHDETGSRVDRVEYHPAYHHLMALSVRYGVHALPWREPRPGAHVARAALLMLASENDFGHCCPISMTYACVPSLRKQPELSEWWEPRTVSLEYDPRFVPAEHKKGVLFGMAMTEKQGGSDVRANSTLAAPAGRAGPGQPYLLTGHKWFCSAPMSDAFLVLAQAPAGLSCFLVPRFLPDGTQNRFLLQRLKDKLGNRSNASSEVEFDQTHGVLIGEEGRGVPVIMDMVSCTRLDSALGSTALLRRALSHALHHTRQRSAFGRPLAEQPLMQNVLADLAIESEAATILVMRLARAYDDAAADAEQLALHRLATPLAKYWICKRAPAGVAEALECLGGNGYVETFPLARLYREAPINSIWEGSGNVICLDIMRTAKPGSAPLAAWFAEIEAAQHAEPRLARYADAVRAELASAENNPFAARRVAERLALGLQAALLVRHAPAAVADAFCATRLVPGGGGRAFGTLPDGVDVATILERAFRA